MSISVAGKKRCGDNQREDLCPELLQIQADALNEAQSRIAEGCRLDSAQHGIVHQRGLFKQKMHNTRLGIEAQAIGDGRQKIVRVDMEAQQVQRARADGKEQSRLQQFVNRDRGQPVVAGERFLGKIFHSYAEKPANSSVRFGAGTFA